ncbi:MAG: 50S ribosomal protein L10, partial [Patescibacteria group bacterium]
VASVTELRNKLFAKNALMKVAKKTLFRIAAKEVGLPELPESALEGPVAFVMSFDDEVSGAKTVLEAGRANDKLKIIGGVLGGKLLSKAEAVELGKIPSREELLAKLLAMFQSPLVQFAGMCQSPLSAFARALEELRMRNQELREPSPSHS